MRVQGRRNGVPKDQNTRRVRKSSFIKRDGGGRVVGPTHPRAWSQGVRSERFFQATSTRAKLWSMPRLFSTYTSYLPLSWAVARRMVSVVVVLPISKNTLAGRGGAGRAGGGQVTGARGQAG